MTQGLLRAGYNCGIVSRSGYIRDHSTFEFRPRDQESTSCSSSLFNQFTQIHTPTVVLFHMLQYFETILPSVESLWSPWQDRVYFMGNGAAGGLERHQQWSPSWILPRIRNQVKIARNGDFLCLTWKITDKHFAWYWPPLRNTDPPPPPIQSCSSKFWAWSCVASNFEKGWRGGHKHKIMDRPFKPKYGRYLDIDISLRKATSIPPFQMGVSLGAICSNPANQIDRNWQNSSKYWCPNWLRLISFAWGSCVTYVFSQSHVRFARVKEYFVSAN